MIFEKVAPSAKNLLEAWRIYGSYLPADPCTMDAEGLSFGEFNSRFQGSGTALFMAREGNGRLVGYASWKPCFGFPQADSFPEVSIYLHRDSHRRGLGKSMLLRLLAEAESEGLAGILSYVTGTNHGGNRLMERTGFSYFGELPGIGAKAGIRASLNLWIKWFPRAGNHAMPSLNPAMVRADGRKPEHTDPPLEIVPWSGRKGFSDLGFLRPGSESLSTLRECIGTATGTAGGSGWRNLLAYSLEGDKDWESIITDAGFEPRIRLRIPYGSGLLIHHRVTHASAAF